MRRRLFLTTTATLLLTSACSSSDEGEAADGPVTIVVNGLPPDTDPINRANFQKDVQAFQAKSRRSPSTPARA